MDRGIKLARLSIGDRTLTGLSLFYERLLHMERHINIKRCIGERQSSLKSTSKVHFMLDVYCVSCEMGIRISSKLSKMDYLSSNKSGRDSFCC